MGTLRDGPNLADWIGQLRQERQTIAALAERTNLGPRRRCDIYLCYGDVSHITFKGFLITWRGDINRVLAYCPVVEHRMWHETSRAEELKRAFESSVRIAASPDIPRKSNDLIWLDAAGDLDRPVPRWVYGLLCASITDEWNGQFTSPQPFCPVLFERMARQPQACRWLIRQPESWRFINSSKTSPRDDAISARMGDVLKCFKMGYSEKETASELGISIHTVHIHAKNLYRHFDVHSKAELLSLFVRSM